MPRATFEDDWFEEVAEQLGIDFVYTDGSISGHYQLLESVGGGIAAVDYDLDGWQDLFMNQGGTIHLENGTLKISGLASGLFRNLDQAGFVNISLNARIAEAELFTHGLTVADINADGIADLIVAGFGGLRAWINLGDGTFEERSSVLGLASSSWNVVPAAADFDLDGLVDLYVVTYADWRPSVDQPCLNDRGVRDICGPTLYSGQQDKLFGNTSDGFADITASVGLVAANRGLGIVAADVDSDGRIDVVVVNDVEANQLYINGLDGRFIEKGAFAGVAYSSSGEREGSMGIDLGDFNHDGEPDLWYTNYVNQDNSLLINTGGAGFVNSSDVMGLGGVSRRWVGFGTHLADFDGDGWQDLFVANGHVAYERLDSPYYQPPQLFANKLGRSAEDVSARAGPYFASDRSGRGSAKVDFDNDGDWDIVIMHQNEPVAVLRNRNSSEFWIRIQLVGTEVERSGVGAKVTVEQGDTEENSWRIGGGSYLSHSDSRMLYTLKSEEPVVATVTWPGGSREVFENLTPNRTYTLIQGRKSYDAP
ncbi:MAG: CRTAC1 family protein [Planctomycetaceae bacterium]|nr:CRTAC1 family protein [Planctomycetales bacterium]MCB9921106.1 CRTAC1 family protein [Planctomycetaceae bacterium]